MLSDKDRKTTVKLHSPEMGIQDLSTVRVLVVEDNKINQLLVKNLLREFGFVNFDCAENGKMVLSLLSGNKYHIILMDIQMPGMDGYELTERIRMNPDIFVSTIPIIALTADDSETERKKAFDAGMNDYLAKPYSPDELLSVICKYLGRKIQKNELVDSKKSADKKETAKAKVKRNRLQLSVLEKYTGGDAAISIRLIELFIDEVPLAIRNLEETIPKKEWKEVHGVIHKVKSCFVIFELSELVKLILSMEENAREIKNVETIPGQFALFKSGSKEILRLLEAELKFLKKAEGTE